MKSIKDLREQFNLVTEKEEHDMNKLSQLVRAGLFDAKKLSALKRAMDKPADKMTSQEKRMMINLLDALMSEVLSDKQVYRKVKQDVMKEAKDWETKDYLSKVDPRYGNGWPDQKQIPSVLLLKRKAIRVFPDGQKVGLYYAQTIDKYVTVPFGELGMQHNVHEGVSFKSVGKAIYRGISSFLDSTANNSSSSSDEPKYLEPLKREPRNLSVGGPKEREDDNHPDARRSNMDRLNRLANQAMVKNVRESFASNLEMIREAGAPRPPKGYIAPKIRPKAGIGPGNKTAPERSVWDKLTDVGDDGTVEGLTKDLMPVIDTVRQAKRTSAAYNKATDEFKKGNYWNAAKGAADTAVQVGLTGLSAAGDAATLTGIGGAVVEPIRAAVAASKVAKAARNAAEVEKFIQKSKTIPVRKTPALPAPETPKITEPTIPTVKIDKTTANKLQNQMKVDVDNTRQSNAANAIRDAESFRNSNPKTTAVDRNAGARVAVKDKPVSDFKPAELETNKGSLVPIKRDTLATAGDRNAGARVAVKDKPVSDFKPAEPETNKGSLTTTPKTTAVDRNAGARVAVKDKPVSDLEKKSSTSDQFNKQNAELKKAEDETNPTKKSEDETPTKKPSLSSLAAAGLLGGLIGLKGLSTTNAKDLSPLKGKLSLNVSGPKREGDPSALASRQASLERKALRAQAVAESINVNLDGNLFELNTNAANKVTSLYESLNKTNRRKMVKLMNESEENLKKIISFAIKQNV